jgi:hypothetical protein
MRKGKEEGLNIGKHNNKVKALFLNTPSDCLDRPTP